MLFTYDKRAMSEIIRFIGLGLVLGLLTGLVYGLVVRALGQPLLVGVVLTTLIFLALFAGERMAKTLYWNLAILLQLVGLAQLGVVGAIVGLVAWFLALRIVPALRYVLQRDNILSVLSAAILMWIVVTVVWKVSLTQGGQLSSADWTTYTIVGAVIGVMYWGIAKIISSGFKEYRYRTRTA